MLQTKALYNLLRLNAATDKTVPAEPWAVEDLRKVSSENLFDRLKAKGIQLDENSFRQFSEDCDTPEELAELLLSDSFDEKTQDALYLIIFEIWRRSLPEKQSLSVFCDELDYQIFLYDQNAEKSDESIQDCLANLIEILEGNVDAGAEPKEIFTTITNFCAHDLESFLYDYVADLLDNGNQLYASELLEGFSPYVSDPIWFDFLKARLISFTDIGKTNAMIHQILEEEIDLSLILEILNFLVVSGEHELFVAATKKILPLLKSTEELVEIMDIAAEYLRRLDLDGPERAMQKIIKKIQKTPGHLPPTQQDIKSFLQLLIESQ